MSSDSASSRSALVMGGTPSLSGGTATARLGVLGGEQHLTELGLERVAVGAQLGRGRLDVSRRAALAEYRSTVSTWNRSPTPTMTLTRRLPGEGALGMWRTRQRRGPISSTSSSWDDRRRGKRRGSRKDSN